MSTTQTTLSKTNLEMADDGDGFTFNVTDGTNESEVMTLKKTGVVDISEAGAATTVKGTLTVNETLGVTGATSLATGGGATTVAGTLDVTGDTSVSTFDSSGATSLATGGGIVNIASTGVMTTVKGTLNVDEAVTLDTTLDVTGDTSVSTFDSTGATSLATGGGLVNIASTGVMTTVKGELTVDEAVLLDNSLEVSGNTSVSTFDSSGATSLATGGGEVNIASTGVLTTVEGTLNVVGAVTLDSDLDVTGDLTVTGTLNLPDNISGVNAEFTGDVTADQFISSSDKNLKTNVVNINNSLENIEKLRGVHFEWIDNEKREKFGSQVGVIAQEVESVYPQLVHTNKEGFKAVDYAKLTAVLIESVKELSAEVKMLKEKLNE